MLQNKSLLCFSYNAWKVEVSEGSHLVCQWSIGGEPENGYTTVLQVRTEERNMTVLKVKAHYGSLHKTDAPLRCMLETD